MLIDQSQSRLIDRSIDRSISINQHWLIDRIDWTKNQSKLDWSIRSILTIDQINRFDRIDRCWLIDQLNWSIKWSIDRYDRLINQQFKSRSKLDWSNLRSMLIDRSIISIDRSFDRSIDRSIRSINQHRSIRSIDQHRLIRSIDWLDWTINQLILIGSIDRSNDQSRVTIGSRPTVLVLLCFVVLDVQGGCVDAYEPNLGLVNLVALSFFGSSVVALFCCAWRARRMRWCWVKTKIKVWTKLRTCKLGCIVIFWFLSHGFLLTTRHAGEQRSSLFFMFMLWLIVVLNVK